MGRGWLALAAAALLVAPWAPRCQEAGERLALPVSSADRLELATLLFSRDPAPRLLTARLTISGIDPHEVRRTVETYNQSSELLQLSRGNLILAPYLLRQAFDMDPGQLLQVQLSARTARLVFQFSWR
jgi:hypothetical protein